MMRKNKLIIVIMTIIAIIILGIVCIFYKKVYVGGHEIDESEYRFYQEENLAGTASDIYSQYGIDLSGDLKQWEKEYDGICPMDILEKNVMEQLAHDYSIRDMADFYGVELPRSWEGTLDSWALFGESRKGDIASGEIVYGPENFELISYYFYLFRNAEQDIVEKISSKLEDNQEEVRQWYDSLPREEVVNDAVVTVDNYWIEDTSFYQKGMEALEKIQPSDVASKGAVLEKMGFQKSTETIDTRTISKEDARTISVIQFAKKQQPGAHQLIEGDSELPVLVVLKEIQLEEVPSYEENRGWAMMRYAYEIYQEELYERIEKMEVKGSFR